MSIFRKAICRADGSEDRIEDSLRMYGETCTIITPERPDGEFRAHIYACDRLCAICDVLFDIELESGRYFYTDIFGNRRLIDYVERSKTLNVDYYTNDDFDYCEKNQNGHRWTKKEIERDLKNLKLSIKQGKLEHYERFW